MQATDEQRRAVADVVLDNSGTPEELAAQVDRFWAERVAPARRLTRRNGKKPQVSDLGLSWWAILGSNQ